MPSIRDNTAVLLMAYGTPGSENEVEPYLTDIRKGRKPTVEQVNDLKRRYREIGGHSPLLEITEAQAAGLEKQLHAKGMRVPVYYGMKHWHPYVAEVVPKILLAGARKIVGLVLAPHYSKMSIGEYRESLERALTNSREVHVDFIESWYDNAFFHKAVVEKVREAFKRFPPDADVSVLFSAHSLPERIIAEDDPYPSQLLDTCKSVAKLARIERWSFAYQSAGYKQEKWLGPDILEALRDMPAKTDVLVAPIGFVADDLEILYDLDVEAQAFAKSHALNLSRIESLNASPAFVAALTDIVNSRMAS